MGYKEFVKLCFYNIRNSIEVSNAQKIMPIKGKDFEIVYENENKLSINSENSKDIIWAENGYFRCDEIIKVIAKIYKLEYIDNKLINILPLQKKLFNVIGLDKVEK